MELTNITEYIVKQLLPDVEVKINELDESNIKIIQIFVPDEHIGKIIGYKGKIANSIRTIVEACAYTNKLGRVKINIDSL